MCWSVASVWPTHQHPRARSPPLLHRSPACLPACLRIVRFDPLDTFRIPLDVSTLPDVPLEVCKEALEVVGAKAAAWSRYLVRNSPARG
jgi:hypothetical protein